MTNYHFSRMNPSNRNTISVRKASGAITKPPPQVHRPTPTLWAPTSPQPRGARSWGRLSGDCVMSPVQLRPPLPPPSLWEQERGGGSACPTRPPVPLGRRGCTETRRDAPRRSAQTAALKAAGAPASGSPSLHCSH